MKSKRREKKQMWPIFWVLLHQHFPWVTFQTFHKTIRQNRWSPRQDLNPGPPENKEVRTALPRCSVTYTRRATKKCPNYSHLRNSNTIWTNRILNPDRFITKITGQLHWMRGVLVSNLGRGNGIFSLRYLLSNPLELIVHNLSLISFDVT